MNPITILENWLSGFSEESLRVIMLLCGVGIYLAFMWIVISGSMTTFRIVKGRRWWK